MKGIILTIMIAILFLVLGFVIYSIIVWNNARNLRYLTESFRSKENRLRRLTADMKKENRLGLPVLYINMDSSNDRQHFMKSQLEEYGIDGTRVSAVNGANIIDIMKGEENGIRFTNNYKINKGELGCTLSHLKAIKQAYDSGHEMVIILEDDACLSLMPLWDSDIPTLVSQVNDWDILQLATSRSNRISNEVRDFNNYWGTFAYVINRNGMQNILGATHRDETFNLDKDRPSQPSGKKDGRADMFLYVTAGRTKTVMMPLIYNASIESQIHTRHDTHVFKRGIEYFDHYLNNSLSHLGVCYVPVKNKPVIWSVWTGTNMMPPYLQLCHETVIRHNDRDFTVILVNPNNVNKFLTDLHPAYELLSYVHRADYLRHALLHKYGGIYLDMDTICFKSLYPKLRLLKDVNVVGYDGSKWGEIWGVSAMGPLRPDSDYTYEWGNALKDELDNKLLILQKYRHTNSSLGKDCLVWASLLRDIILPLSHDIKHRIRYKIIDEDWQAITDTDIVRRGNMPEINSSILLLNNALYGPEIKEASKDTVLQSDIILFKLLSRALASPLPSFYLLPKVDAILYINLDHRQDRRDTLFQQFQSIGIDPGKLTRIPAVSTPANGAIGCLESHIKALEYATHFFPNQNIMIIEDDILCKNRTNLRIVLDDFFNDPYFNTYWDVILLAYNMKDKRDTHDKNVIRALEAQTSAAYLVHGEYVDVIHNNLLKSLNTYRSTGKWISSYCNDQCWKTLQREDNWYAIQPPPFIQGTSYSDIEQKLVSYRV